jgi:hypothetical protein
LGFAAPATAPQLLLQACRTHAASGVVRPRRLSSAFGFGDRGTRGRFAPSACLSVEMLGRGPQVASAPAHTPQASPHDGPARHSPRQLLSAPRASMTAACKAAHSRLRRTPWRRSGRGHCGLHTRSHSIDQPAWRAGTLPSYLCGVQKHRIPSFCGGGGGGRFSRGRGALLAVSLHDFRLPSVTDRGRGDWRAPDRPCSCQNVYTLMFIYTFSTLVNFLRRSLVKYWGGARVWLKLCVTYASHSFSVQTSKLVHINFLTPLSCRVLGRRACVVEAVRYYASHSFSVQTTVTGFDPGRACNEPPIGEPHQSGCYSITRDFMEEKLV